MKKRNLAQVSAALLMIVLGFASCKNEHVNETGLPKAELLVTFEPNPTPYVRPNEWEYRVYLREVNGVGVNIYGWIIQGYTTSGQKYEPLEKSQLTFEEEFLRCGGTGNYLPPGGVRCSDRLLFDRPNLGYNIWTFYGVDDNGNEIEGSGRQELI